MNGVEIRMGTKGEITAQPRNHVEQVMADIVMFIEDRLVLAYEEDDSLKEIPANVLIAMIITNCLVNLSMSALQERDIGARLNAVGRLLSDINDMTTNCFKLMETMKASKENPN